MQNDENAFRYLPDRYFYCGGQPDKYLDFAIRKYFAMED